MKWPLDRQPARAIVGGTIMEGFNFRPDDIGILIVGNSKSQRSALQNLLSEHGYCVAIAENGDAALRQLQRAFALQRVVSERVPALSDGSYGTDEIIDSARDNGFVSSWNRPRLLISDISMPRLNGYELCAAIKSDDNLRHLPVILLTTLSRPEDILRALDARADSYLTTPFDEQYLLSRIAALLEAPPADEESPLPMEIAMDGTRYPVSVGQRQMLDLLVCTYEHAVHQNRTLTQVQDDLQALNEELRRQAERLEASRANYRALLENSDDATVVVDGSGSVRYANAAARQLFGRSEAEFLERPFDWDLSRQGNGEVDISRPKKDRRASERKGREHVIAELRVVETEWEGAPAHMATLRDITTRKRSEEQIAKQQNELREANAKLERLATLDSLTGLKNRRAFQERLADEMRRASRYGQPLSLVMLDVDRFKEYNDTFLHLAGDEVLRRLGQILPESARTSDFSARYGGEEFAVLLPNTDGHSAQALAERLRAAIENEPWPLRPVTASLGIATLVPTAVGDEALREESQRLIAAADRALYQSKANGRNCNTAVDLNS